MNTKIVEKQQLNIEIINSVDDNNFDDEIEEEPGPTSERWDPLGADNNDDDLNNDLDTSALFNYIPETGNGIGASGGSILTYNESFNQALGLQCDPNRIRNLEEEQEILTTSLMALTSHFAQVQFRLRQIVEAPIDDRDQLLKSLEEFAFRGVPEITGHLNSIESEEVISNLERARQRQFDLIERLKGQLSELEKFAYESGAPVLPQSIIVEKQKIIIDELKNKLNLNVNENDLPQLTTEDLRNHVDSAIGEFVGPLKMKEQLVTQLKTQITDLERFIAFLQCDSEENKLKSVVDTNDVKRTEAYNSYSAKKKNCTTIIGSRTKQLITKQASACGGGGGDISSNFDQTINKTGKPERIGEFRKERVTTETSLNQKTENSIESEENLRDGASSSGETESFNSKAHSLMDKASTLLQMFALTQFGCGSTRFQKNTLKKTSRINHWGDTRAQLEVDIQEVLSLAMTIKRDREKLSSGSSSNINNKYLNAYDDYTSDSEDGVGICNGNNLGGGIKKPDNSSLTNVELTAAVRRNFAITLQKLIQHGLRGELDTATSLVPFISCFNTANGVRNIDNHVPNSDDDYDVENSERNITNLGGIGHRQMHAWELILEYYNIKNGDKYNETPARKLSQSFNLNIVGGNAVSNKQSLLSAIGTIITMHSPYKRSYNSHFKAFICAGLNGKKLVSWLNLIFQCTELINSYYTSWSYVACTGFRDALRSLDRLTKYDFDLPVDLAVRQFQNIKDVFM